MKFCGLGWAGEAPGNPRFGLWSSPAVSDSGTGSNRHPGQAAINHPAGNRRLDQAHFLNGYQFLQGTKSLLSGLGNQLLSL
ncbi:hypothetical protein SKAU_G00081860 [Synaphobranchus kaupii]|uniref:Uncharacterized protein n=1 Tax=Synaphobranchus kaupii TaxID=118154 RepID=A0A9Q1FVS9_SYNKA|nr:hypothetical protein SKAU_G00081860 [Synaphobranchus kaupii]